MGKSAVSQGSDTPYNVPDNSHRGYASFCLDMVRNDGPTEGEPVLAAADGTVVVVRDSTPDRPSVFRPEWTIPDCTPCNGFADGSCGYLSNEVTIKHAPTEYTQYLHLMHGSVPSWIKEKLKNGEPVKRGRMIGLAGRTGAPGPHLHVCMGWATFFLPGPVTASGKDEPVTANPLVAGSCGYKPAVAPPRGWIGRARSSFQAILSRPEAARSSSMRERRKSGRWYGMPIHSRRFSCCPVGWLRRCRCTPCTATSAPRSTERRRKTARPYRSGIAWAGQCQVGAGRRGRSALFHQGEAQRKMHAGRRRLARQRRCHHAVGLREPGSPQVEGRAPVAVRVLSPGEA